MKTQRGFTPIILLFITVLVVIVVAGAYLYGKGGLKLLTKQPTSPGVQVSATPTLANDETANWKIFSSKYYGFSNKYPTDWENDNFCYQCPAQPVIEESNERYFHSKQDKYPKGIMYMIGSKEGSASLEVIENTARNWNLKNQRVEDITIDGSKGIKVSGYDENGQEVGVAVFENKDYIFQVSNHQGYSDILKQILSTFKFTN